MARKRKKEQESPAIAQEVWEQLYSLAVAYRNTKPWEFMTEDELFGVEDPVTGVVNYCMVTGELDEHRALIVTLGPEGLGQYFDAIRRMQTCVGALEEMDAGFSMMTAPQVQVSFEDRQYLFPEDLQVIKSLGLRFRGRMNWPMFRNFEPGRAPWFITPETARILAVCLEQTLAFIEQLDWVDAQYQQNAQELSGKLPVRYMDGDVWALRWDVPDPVFPEYEYPVDGALLEERGRRLPKSDVVMEVHLTVLPAPVEEGPLPPYLPYLLTLGDSESGMMLGQRMLIAKPSQEELLRSLHLEVLAMFEELNLRPKRALVATERLYRLLSQPFVHLGVPLKRRDHLPMTESAIELFQRFMASDAFDNLDLGDLRPEDLDIEEVLESGKLGNLDITALFEELLLDDDWDDEEWDDWDDDDDWDGIDWEIKEAA